MVNYTRTSGPAVRATVLRHGHPSCNNKARFKTGLSYYSFRDYPQWWSREQLTLKNRRMSITEKTRCLCKEFLPTLRLRKEGNKAVRGKKRRLLTPRSYLELSILLKSNRFSELSSLSRVDYKKGRKLGMRWNSQEATSETKFWWSRLL